MYFDVTQILEFDHPQIWVVRFEKKSGPCGEEVLKIPARNRGGQRRKRQFIEIISQRTNFFVFTHK